MRAGGDEGPEGEEERPRLNLEVKIDDRSACQRHITVTVSREDIDRYLNKEFSELMPEAHVPGFRPGHAPRKLVENRFRKDVVGRVKSALLMDSLSQIHEDYDLSAIGEPELDLETVEVPEQGPMTFEFDLEVRPQFDLPQWKGLQIEKPVREFTDADIDQALKRYFDQPRPPRAGRRSGGTGRLHHHEPDFQARRAGPFQRRGRSHSAPPGAQLPRRQDRRFRQGHGRRPRRRDPRIDHATQRRRSQRGPSRAAGHRASSKCSKSRSCNCRN